MKRYSKSIWPILLITLLLGLFAAPVSAQNQPAPNPDLAPQCALDIIFILDESLSIDAADATDNVREAMEAIVADMAGTGSYMAVVEFNLNARRAIIGGTTAYQEIDAGYITNFSTYINNNSLLNTATGYNPASADSAGTNWEAALIQAISIGQRVPGRAPLVIFFTDGVPNRYIDVNGNVAGTGAGLNATALNEAVGQANTIKAAGSHIFVPAYGDVTTSSIQQISGTDALNPPTVEFPQADYVVGAEPGELAAAIKQSLASLCAPSVSIKKLVDEGDGNGYVEASGWEFSASVEVDEPGEDDDDYEWTTPVSGTAGSPDNLGLTQSDTTDVDGNAQFAWTPGTVDVPQPWVTEVSFTETNQPGYQFVSGLCVLRDDDEQTENVEIPIQSLPLTNWITLESNEYLSCEIRNAAEDFTVTKTANPTQVVAPGGSVVYTVRIDNNTDAQLTIDSLDDNQFGDITLPAPFGPGVTASTCSLPQPIVAQGFYECTFTADVEGEAGSTHTNVVEACEGENCDDDDADVEIVGASIVVLKSANPTEVVAPGGSVVFTVSIENTGEVPVTIDTLVDNVFGDITTVQGDVTATTCDDLPLLLAVDSPAYQCTFTANVEGEPDTTHTNEVEACDTLSYAEFVCDDDDADVDIVEAAIEVTKSADPTQVVAPGGPVVFTVNIENTGDVPVTIDYLDDDTFGDITAIQGEVTATTCVLPQLIAVGLDYECTFTANVTGLAGDTHTNIVEACDTTTYTNEVCDDDDADVDIVEAAIVVTKSADPTQVVAPGGPVVFTVNIENTGDVPVTIDYLDDDTFGDITAIQGEVTATTCVLPQLIAVGLDYECTFTANVTGLPGDTHTNIVEACDTTTYTNEVCDDDDAEVDIVGTPGIQVIKTANPTQVTAPGGPVVFTVHVDNNGDVPLDLSYLDDSVYGDITTIGHDTITATTCDVTPPVVIAVDGFYECTFTASVTGSPGTTHVNTVEACDFILDELCDEDDAEVDIVGTPEIEVTKTANPTEVTYPGGPVVFTVLIENTGDVPVTIDYLDDDVFGDITTTGHDGITATTCDLTPPVLIPFEGQYQCTFTATVTGDAGTTHINTVEACDTTTYEGDICDEDDAEVDIIGDGSFCPAESDDVGLSMTSMLGMGQGSTTKAFKTRKIVVPNYQDVISLYGQLAAVDVGIMKYVRFLYPNNTFVKVIAPTSPAYRSSAVDWWGAELTPSIHIRGQFIWGKGAGKAPRAFVLWPEYETTERYASVFVPFDESHENHVYWEPSWYNTQVQTIAIPTTQSAGADITVRVALVDNNLDTRPVTLTIEAGGVTQVITTTGPNAKDTLNLHTVVLTNVPAGTDEIVLTLQSFAPDETHAQGDSVAMIGMSASYACEDVER